MSLHVGDVDRAWNKLGFQITDSRHRVAKLFVDKKLILVTSRSHGSGKLDGNIPTFIRQQMKLNEKQFQRAIDCPLKRSEYLNILKRKGLW